MAKDHFVSSHISNAICLHFPGPSRFSHMLCVLGIIWFLIFIFRWLQHTPFKEIPLTLSVSIQKQSAVNRLIQKFTNLKFLLLSLFSFHSRNLCSKWKDTCSLDWPITKPEKRFLFSSSLEISFGYWKCSTCTSQSLINTSKFKCWLHNLQIARVYSF